MIEVFQSSVEVPERIAKLPRDRRGYPVPWFVAWIDGQPDFRVIDPDRMARCVKERRCWLCGEPLGAYRAFVIGPMCAINRVSSEPPSHRDCAVYAARVCPFLTKPRMRRRESGLPEEVHEAAGVGLKRNPGVALVWVTKQFEMFRAPGGVLFRVGDPVETMWFAEGRSATREEVLASIDSGLPLLMEPAKAEGPSAIAALERMHREALVHLPT